MRSPSIRAVLLSLVASLCAGCLPPSAALERPGAAAEVAGARILVMPVDLEYYEMTNAGEILQPQWTTTARENVRLAFEKHFEASGGDVVFYTPPDDPERSRLHQQLRKLHRAIAQTIAEHDYPAPEDGVSPKLPTRTGLDWTLGEGVRDLHVEYGADFALFFFARGRAPDTKMEALHMLTGSGIQGTEASAISIVDLRTGDIVWFSWEKVPLTSSMQQAIIEAVPDSWNRLGDFRRVESADNRVELLLRGLPR